MIRIVFVVVFAFYLSSCSKTETVKADGILEVYEANADANIKSSIHEKSKSTNLDDIIQFNQLSRNAVFNKSDFEIGIEVYIFNMKQADSMLIVGPPPLNRTLLVDAGEQLYTKKDATNLKYLANRIFEITGENHIDYFVASHYHYDHLGGGVFGGVKDLVDVHGFTIGTIIHPGELNGNQMDVGGQKRSIKKRFIEKIYNWRDDGKVNAIVVANFLPGLIDLGKEVDVEVVATRSMVYEGDIGLIERIDQSVQPSPYSKYPASENDLSIAFIIRYKDFELFTGGDLTGNSHLYNEEVHAYQLREFGGGKGNVYSNVESYMVEYWRDITDVNDVEIYRANHHGSGHSSTPELVEALDPEFIIYSTAGQFNYHHPNKDRVVQGSLTARQLVTTGIDYGEWENDHEFENYNAKIVGEVDIKVGSKGKWYLILGEPHRIYTDNEELNDRDQREEYKDYRL